MFLVHARLAVNNRREFLIPYVVISSSGNSVVPYDSDIDSEFLPRQSELDFTSGEPLE